MFFFTFLWLFAVENCRHPFGKGAAVIYNKYGLNKRNVLAKLAINKSCARARAISMQMLAANHTPNERSSDNCNSNNCGNSDCGNNWQLRVAQSLEAERQLAAYTQFPQTRPDPTKNMTSNGKQRAITASDTTELRPKQKQKQEKKRRRRGRTEGNLQDAEAVAHGRASWALKSPRCDEAANWLSQWVSQQDALDAAAGGAGLGLGIRMGHRYRQSLSLSISISISVACQVNVAQEPFITPLGESAQLL